MDQDRTEKLQELLRKLGKAVHASVVRSSEVKACLAELHEEGWQAVLMIEASLASADDDSLEVERAALRLQIPSEVQTPEYRLDRADARLLGSLGISPGRHRSNGTRLVRHESRPDSENERS